MWTVREPPSEGIELTVASRSHRAHHRIELTKGSIEVRIEPAMRWRWLVNAPLVEVLTTLVGAVRVRADASDHEGNRQDENNLP